MGALGRHADLGVAEDLHDDTLIDALGEQQGGRGVPGVMDPHVTDTGGF
jgi:hypothetical protein